MRLVICAICLLVLTVVGQAQNTTPTPTPTPYDCRLYLANQVNVKSNSGFSLALESFADSNHQCQLDTVRLRLSVGDGTALQHIDANLNWTMSTNGYYIAKAVITPNSQQLEIDSDSTGQINQLFSDRKQGAFKPANQTLYSSFVADSGIATENYIVSQLSQQIISGPKCLTNGSNCVSLAPNGGNRLPISLILLAGGPAPWATSFTADFTQTTTITATFRFDPVVSDVHKCDPYIDPINDPFPCDPYIDKYGQAVKANWPGKVFSDDQLLSNAANEQTWFTQNPGIFGGPHSQLDQYGGLVVAGPPDATKPYYHTAQLNGRWYLISPFGNPLFYIGMTAIPDYSTPITGREGMFPPDVASCKLGTIPDACTKQFDPQAKQDAKLYSFSVANMIRKFGSSWQDQKTALMRQRFSSWGFMGGGKFGVFPSDMPITPILAHHGFGDSVPNAPGATHPDIFNLTTVSAMQTFLEQDMATQTCSDPSATTCDPKHDQRILGWSVGNEKDEIIASSDITGILGYPAASPAKQELIDYAFTVLHGSKIKSLANAWGIPVPAQEQDLYDMQLTPSGKDLEPLRQYYAKAYYAKLYEIVATNLDQNHLYLGIWTLANDSADWPLIAANCDVVGFDDFSPGPLSKKLQALFASTNKPVLLGAWGVPSDYGGTRGFGWNKYEKLMTLSDADSGDAYSKLMKSAVKNQYVVGTMLFDYRDEPLTGRGNSDGSGNITGQVVVEENFAFGLVDITDTPKYDLVNKVRAENIASLLTLGLLKDTTPPVSTATVTGPFGLDGWYVGPTIINFAATDDFSGVVKTEYSLDKGTNWITGTAVTLKANAIHDILYRSTDLAGNIETPKSIIVKLDSQPPGTIVNTRLHSVGGVPIFLEVDLNATDNLSGVAKTQYSLDHGATWQTGKVISLCGGTRTILYFSTDVAGNTEKQKSLTVSTPTCSG